MAPRTSPTLLKCRTCPPHQPRSVWLSLFCDFDLGLNATTSERRAFLLEPILRLASSLPTPVLFGWFVSRTRDSGQQTESWVCPFPASEPGHVLDPSPRPFPPLSSGDVRPSLASFLQGPLRGRRNTGWKGVLERRSVVRRWPDGFMMSEDSSGPGECQGSVSKAQSLAQKEYFFLLRQ